MNKHIDFLIPLIVKVIVGSGLLVFSVDFIMSEDPANQLFGLVLICIGSYHIITANSLYKKRKR